RAAVAAIEKEVQEIRMRGRSPAAGRDGMHQRQPQHIAIELDRFLELPGRPRRMVDALKPERCVACHVNLLASSLDYAMSHPLFRCNGKLVAQPVLDETSGDVPPGLFFARERPAVVIAANPHMVLVRAANGLINVADRGREA